MKKRATIRDVAEKAGVSIATVSFVLNKRVGETISERVKKRVIKAAEQLDYHPSASARGLARQRTHNVAIVFYRDSSSIANAFYSFVVQGIIKETTQRQYNLLFSFVDDEYESTRGLPRVVQERNTEGILLLHFTSAAMAADIQALGIPVVAIDVYPHLEQSHAVEIDNAGGVRLAAQHLFELGHRHVGFLYAARERFSIGERCRGFLDALASAGLAGGESWLHDCGELNHESGHARALTLLQAKERPTALMCANDEMASGALRAAHELGLRIPEDLSVVGFDNIHMCDFMNPPLTTVGIDKEEMGRRAVRSLLALVEKQEVAPSPERMPAELVLRQSTARPRA